MSRAGCCLAALLSIAVGPPGAAASPVVAARPTGAAPLYSAIRTELRRSAVTVLLPLRVPRSIGPIRSVALIDAGASGYYVGFSPLPQCAGALSCAFLHVYGYPATAGMDRSYRRDRAVRLPGGARGFYHPQDCSSAGCTEASLTFERGGAVYELDAKVGPNNLAPLLDTYRGLHVIR
jgi:hypothetical protein